MQEKKFLYCGADFKILKPAIYKKIEELNISDFNISEYDLSQQSFYDALNDLSSFSFFNDSKAIIIKNFNLLNNQELGALYDYIKNPNENNYLFLMSEKKLELEPKSPINLYVEHIEISNPSDEKLFEIIKNKFLEEDFKISNQAIDELIIRCDNNYELIDMEIEKIKTYLMF